MRARDRRIGEALLVALALALPLASCSDPSSDGGSGPTTTATPAPSTTTEATAPSDPDDGPGERTVEATGPAVVWQIEQECADSILASDRIVVVNCDGIVSAHDRLDGSFLWAFETGDDGQATPGITADETVVYAPFDSPQFARALDGRTGLEVAVPTSGVRTTYTAFDLPDDEVLPSGYSYDSAGLRYGEVVIWPGGAPDVTGIGPFVHRQSDATIINDSTTGLRVVADDGTVQLERPVGTRSFDASPVWDIGHGHVALAASDGILYVLDLA